MVLERRFLWGKGFWEKFILEKGGFIGTLNN